MSFFRRQLQPEIIPFPVPHSVQADDAARQADILARTLWGEGRGESVAGREAIANVVLNRVCLAQRRGGAFWWGNSIETVCLKPKQFSCWNENDPNCRLLKMVTREDTQFAMCLRIARRAISGTLADNTHGADHYHADTILPKWAIDRTPVCAIGNHIFYRLEK